MNWDEVTDFAKSVNEEIAGYSKHYILNPNKMLAANYTVSNLEWSAIAFETGDIEHVPNDKRGVYGFAIHVESKVLPPHWYVAYVGIAGRNSERTLRDRYRDYLQPKRVIKRGNIASLIGNWRKVLQFVFAPVDDTVSTDDLQRLETEINTTLLPPFSKQDIEAEVRTRRRAWQ